MVSVIGTVLTPFQECSRPPIRIMAMLLAPGGTGTILPATAAFVKPSRGKNRKNVSCVLRGEWYNTGRKSIADKRLAQCNIFLKMLRNRHLAEWRFLRFTVKNARLDFWAGRGIIGVERALPISGWLKLLSQI